MKVALYNDSFQNWKSHDIEKAEKEFEKQQKLSMYGEA